MTARHFLWLFTSLSSAVLLVLYQLQVLDDPPFEKSLLVLGARSEEYRGIHDVLVEVEDEGDEGLVGLDGEVDQVELITDFSRAIGFLTSDSLHWPLEPFKVKLARLKLGFHPRTILVEIVHGRAIQQILILVVIGEAEVGE